MKSPRKKARRAVKIRRKRKTAFRAAENRCKTLWGGLIRSKGECEKCHKRETLQAAHILPKGMYRNMRFDPENGLCLCHACHFYWWHRDPIGVKLWFDNVYPGRAQYLRDKAAKAAKVDHDAVVEELVNHLKGKT